MSKLAAMEGELDAVILFADRIIRDAQTLAEQARHAQEELGRLWPEEHPCGDTYEVPLPVRRGAQQMAEHLPWQRVEVEYPEGRGGVSDATLRS